VAVPGGWGAQGGEHRRERGIAYGELFAGGHVSTVRARSDGADPVTGGDAYCITANMVPPGRQVGRRPGCGDAPGGCKLLGGM
jgi:hypothetical protein